jgi:succinyl-CoA synthetase alpha subunit
MSILIDKQTRVLVQGITGKQGRKLSLEMLDYGTHVVAGVTPGRGGEDACGLPVYSSVAEAVAEHPEINASLVSVPREGAKDAVLEAVACAQIKLVNVLTEGVPQRDAAQMVQAARLRGVRLIGPASIGLIDPVQRVKLGAIGGNDPGVFYPGQIAVFSKSGGMCLSIATEIFNALGYGTSIVVGIGGDRITGTNFRDLLELVRDDPGISLVILNGEVGGDYEEEAARYIRETAYPKPVVARLTGIGAQNIFPRGSRMGHAGAIIGEGQLGTYESKAEAFEKAGVGVAKTSAELVAFVQRAMPHRPPDFEAPVTKEFELVSVSKTRLENLKSQVRAVQLRTHLTQIVDGTPYFRGRPLPQLMRRATLPQMIFEAIVQEDADQPRVAQTMQDLAICAAVYPADPAARAAAAASLRGGSPINAAISAGLLALPAAEISRLPAGFHERYPAAQAEAMLLFPQVIDLAASVLGNELRWDDAAGIESIVFRALAGRRPSDAEAILLRAMFVCCVDHTPATPSSLAAITSYSGGNSLKTALAAGITAMGDTHAGAAEGTARLLSEWSARLQHAMADGGALETDGVRITGFKELAVYLVNRATGRFGGKKWKIPGYGHRHYSLYGRDPRAVTLLAMAEELRLAGRHCALAREIEGVLKGRKSTGLCFNVDGVIGALLCDLGIPPAAGKAAFIIPRSVGILGQLLEQDPDSFFRLSNDSIIYIGPPAR